MFDFRRPIAAVMAGLATMTLLIVINFIFAHATGRGWTQEAAMKIVLSGASGFVTARST